MNSNVIQAFVCRKTFDRGGGGWGELCKKILYEFILYSGQYEPFLERLYENFKFRDDTLYIVIIFISKMIICSVFEYFIN